MAEPVPASTSKDAAAVNNDYTEEPTGIVARPEGWMYRERKIGPLVIPWYASPKMQLIMVAFVCFLCPG